MTDLQYYNRRYEEEEDLHKKILIQRKIAFITGVPIIHIPHPDDIGYNKVFKNALEPL